MMLGFFFFFPFDNWKHREVEVSFVSNDLFISF